MAGRVGQPCEYKSRPLLINSPGSWLKACEAQPGPACNANRGFAGSGQQKKGESA
jgi:hypothetical protein